MFSYNAEAEFEPGIYGEINGIKPYLQHIRRPQEGEYKGVTNKLTTNPMKEPKYTKDFKTGQGPKLPKHLDVLAARDLPKKKADEFYKQVYETLTKSPETGKK